MIFGLNKYRKKLTAVILTSYLLLVSVSILHYHHIDMQMGNYNFTRSSNDTCNDPFDKLVDITHECAVQQFTSTVINYNFITVFNVTKETSVQNLFVEKITKLPARRFLAAIHSELLPYSPNPKIFIKIIATNKTVNNTVYNNSGY